MVAKEEKTSSSSSSSNIPLEIYEVILSKLPLRSLLRLKTVSKSWNTMISDPVFAHIHLQSSKKNSPNNLFLMHTNNGKGISLFKFEGGKVHREAVMENPFGSRVQVLCHYNGILLLKKNGDDRYYDVKDDQHKCIEYALWNPSTRMETYFFEFPYKNLHGEHRCLHPLTHGMHYDPITHDFKVVVIGIDCYRIYSYKNSSWTEKKGIGLFHGSTMHSGIFVDGATYWVLVELNNKLSIKQIVYFDLKTDELKRLQKPKEVTGHNNEEYMKVASLRDRLCLYYCTKDADDGMTQIRLWIKGKGVLENPSWEEFGTINENVLGAPIRWLRPVCLVENKIVIEIDEERYVYYSPCEKTIEQVEDADDDFWGGFVVPYLDSLLFPAGVKQTIASISYSENSPPPQPPGRWKRKLAMMDAPVEHIDYSLLFRTGVKQTIASSSSSRVGHLDYSLSFPTGVKQTTASSSSSRDGQLDYSLSLSFPTGVKQTIASSSSSENSVNSSLP